MTEIQFELRKRNIKRPEFWSLKYNSSSGSILSIEPGQSHDANCLILPYFKVKNILNGSANQNDFKIVFDENVKSLNLIDLKTAVTKRKKHNWVGWLSAGEFQHNDLSNLRFILFTDTGILRAESNRAWSTELKEKMEIESIENTIPFYITDNEDPHQLFGTDSISLIDIVERGFWEKRLWSFMDHELTSKILYHGQGIRINMQPISPEISYIRVKEYAGFSGVIDEQTILSHKGFGKHISIFRKDGGIWAQSYYQIGSPIEQLSENLKVAVLSGEDLESFSYWAELPILMLRQPYPFELIPEWQYDTLPTVLYKANNLDIGVLS